MSTAKPTSPIINLADVPLERYAHGDKFEVKDGGIAYLIGAKLLGCSLRGRLGQTLDYWDGE